MLPAFRRRSTRLAASLAVAILAAGVAVPGTVAAARGSALVPSSWTCDQLGSVVFLLPPVKSTVAPYPGFLEPSGQTWIVEAIGPIGGPLSSVGQKRGIGPSQICVSTDFGVEILAAPASR